MSLNTRVFRLDELTTIWLSPELSFSFSLEPSISASSGLLSGTFYGIFSIASILTNSESSSRASYPVSLGLSDLP